MSNFIWANADNIGRKFNANTSRIGTTIIPFLYQTSLKLIGIVFCSYVHVLLWCILTEMSELLVDVYLDHKSLIISIWRAMLHIHLYNRCRIHYYTTTHYYSLHPLPRLSHSNTIQTRCTKGILVGRWEYSGTSDRYCLFFIWFPLTRFPVYPLRRSCSLRPSYLLVSSYKYWSNMHFQISS